MVAITRAISNLIREGFDCVLRVGTLADSSLIARPIGEYPDYRPLPMPVSLLYANRRHLPRRVQAFMTWIEKLIRERLA